MYHLLQYKFEHDKSRILEYYYYIHSSNNFRPFFQFQRNDQLHRLPYKDKINDLDYLMRVHRTQQQRKSINYPKGLKSIPKSFKNKLVRLEDDLIM